MDIAKCTLDNKTYSVKDFESLEPSELAKKRRFLECKCGGPAFFRKASRSGQGACFGARPHKEGCDLASPDSETINGSLSPEDKEFINSGNEIRLDLQYGAVESKHVTEDGEINGSGKNKGTSHSSENGKSKSVLQRRLSTLLRTLVKEKDFFKDSNQEIYFKAKHPYYAKNFFVHSDYITKKYMENINFRSYRAIWSMISDCRYTKDKKSLWLNTGGNDNVSILIEEKHLSEFMKRFKIKDIEELSGKYVLNIGKLRESKNNKTYSVLEDISYISVV
jgi:hypothetical protein